MQQESNNFIHVNKVPWKMVARWAEGGEVAATLFEDAFGGAGVFHVHGTGHRMGGRGAVSEITQK